MPRKLWLNDTFVKIYSQHRNNSVSDSLIFILDNKEKYADLIANVYYSPNLRGGVTFEPRILSSGYLLQKEQFKDSGGLNINKKLEEYFGVPEDKEVNFCVNNPDGLNLVHAISNTPNRDLSMMMLEVYNDFETLLMADNSEKSAFVNKKIKEYCKKYYIDFYYLRDNNPSFIFKKGLHPAMADTIASLNKHSQADVGYDLFHII